MKQHSLVQPPIQQKCQYQCRTQIPCTSEQALLERPETKLFNHNTIKISYSCMNNTKQIIDNHNKRIPNSSKHISVTVDNTNTKDTKTCCQSSLIYQVTVTSKDNSTTETYIGLTENDFKTRYRNHTASFQHTKLRNSSKHVWTLKDININHYISRSTLSSRSSYNSTNKRCNLCLKEKLLIICLSELSSLNKGNELMSSCHHRNKT